MPRRRIFLAIFLLHGPFPFWPHVTQIQRNDDTTPVGSVDRAAPSHRSLGEKGRKDVIASHYVPSRQARPDLALCTLWRRPKDSRVLLSLALSLSATPHPITLRLTTPRPTGLVPICLLPLSFPTSLCLSSRSQCLSSLLAFPPPFRLVCLPVVLLACSDHAAPLDTRPLRCLSDLCRGHSHRL